MTVLAAAVALGSGACAGGGASNVAGPSATSSCGTGYQTGTMRATLDSGSFTATCIRASTSQTVGAPADSDYRIAGYDNTTGASILITIIGTNRTSGAFGTASPDGLVVIANLHPSPSQTLSWGFTVPRLGGAYDKGSGTMNFSSLTKTGATGTFTLSLAPDDTNPRTAFMRASGSLDVGF